MLVCDPWPLEVVIVAMLKRAARRPKNTDSLCELHQVSEVLERLWITRAKDRKVSLFLNRGVELYAEPVAVVELSWNSR